MSTLLAFLPVVLMTGIGCVSTVGDNAERTARLRQFYPAGMTKQEVQAKWHQTKADFSATRPLYGWPAYQNQYIARKIEAIEEKAGKKVESVERYWGPDGLMSLCYCWYFYDSDGKIVDVEWQYKSD